MTQPPNGEICADCKRLPAAVQAGRDWLCWDCDERATAPQAAESKTTLEPAEGADLRDGRQYRYDELWQRLLAAPPTMVVAHVFASVEEARRATVALRRRALRNGMRLYRGIDREQPAKRRFRLGRVTAE